jgi:hypothetical protein
MLPKGTRPSWLPALVLALSLLATPAAVPAQPAVQAQALIDAVTGNPGDAPRLAAQEIVAGGPESAVRVVTDVVRALPYDQRLAVAPRVVSAAIGALPAPQRASQAPVIACAAIGAVPAEQQSALVVPIAVAAAAMAPAAGPRIAICASDAVPGSAAAIIAALGLPPEASQLSATPPSPLPGSSIGRDILFQPQPRQATTCASPPCP